MTKQLATHFYVASISQRHGEYEPVITFRFKLDDEAKLNEYLAYHSRTWMGDSESKKFDKDDLDCTAYEHNGGEVITVIESCEEVSEDLFKKLTFLSDLSDYDGENYN